jgi:YVTN family beta-propeller protein
MNPEDADATLYPNRADDGIDSRAVSRRRLLAGSATAGAAVAAGCVDAVDDGGGETSPETVFVFNTGEGTVSLIDAASDEVVDTLHLGATASFPSNQFTPTLSDDASAPLWLNVDGGVRAIEAGTLETVAKVTTGSGANWQERTPDGAHVVVSAREPAHRQVRIDADPNSERFGEETARIERRSEGGAGDADGPGPCDVTIHPDGEYAYVADLFGDALTVLDVESFEIVEQVAVEPNDGGRVKPWMTTAAWDGEHLLVENNGGEAGSESIWDISDPTAPEERVRLTRDDGLGRLPLTSEIGPKSATGYVFTPDSESVSVVDIAGGTVATQIDVGGEAFVGTWGPSREKLYVPVQTSDEVTVIDHAEREVVATVGVGAEPYGATAASVRPEGSRTEQLLAGMAGMGLELAGAGTTYCIGNCACGHKLE